MGVGDGTIVGLTKIVDNGSEAERFNIVLVAEGYQATELDQFASDVQDFINHLVTHEPFPTYQAALNIYRLDVASTDSGADDPAACGGSGATPATYFDASFCHGGIRRALTADTGLVIDTVNSLFPEWHQIIVVVNSSIWGGTGGSVAVTSTAAGWVDIAIHELGHAAFALADEYEYWAGCGIDTGHDNYTYGEPAAANVTTDTNRATIKWGDLIDPTTDLPTTINADCAYCDPQPSSVPAGTVGAFEGAYYYHCGIYRPEFNCMMRNLVGFCAVCRRRLGQVLSPYLPLNHDLDRFCDILEHYVLWPKIILPRWILVAYLLVNWRMKDLAENLKFHPSKEFYDTVAHHLGAYLVKDTMPPEEIAVPILNMADDYLANRPMNLKAGDYLAIQNFMRQRR